MCACYIHAHVQIMSSIKQFLYPTILASSLWVIHDLSKKYLEIIKMREERSIIAAEERREQRDEQKEDEQKEDEQKDDDEDSELLVIHGILQPVIAEQQQTIKLFVENFISNIDRELNDDKPQHIIIPNELNFSDVPDEYKCPISKEIMRDPVQSSDGHTYEREMIEQHMYNVSRSPVTRQEFLVPFLITNWNIRKAIQSYIDAHSVNYDDNVSSGNTVIDDNDAVIPFDAE